MAEEKTNPLEKVSIVVLRAFYRNGELLKIKQVVDGVPRFEAAGYAANRKAQIVEKKAAPPPAPPAEKGSKREEKKS